MARLAAALLLLAAAIGASGQLVIEDAKRQIDLSDFVVHEQLQLSVRNDGRDAAPSLLLCDRNLARAAYFEVKEAGAAKDAKAPKLQWKAAAPAGAPAGVACREYSLPQPLAKKDSVKLTAFAAYTHVLRPEPAEIRQRDAQHVLFEGGAQLDSPYKVESQSTELKVGGSVQSASEVSPSKRSGRQLSYGPYSDVAPWAAQPISVHYENNAPFAAATELEREIDISHWGSVYFEERYSVRHAGAKVVGEWSRWDMTRDPKQFAQAGIPAFRASLPPVAQSLYFRDAIGNISSSETRRSDEAVQVNLLPRYPLFGGWATKFIFGFSLPLGAAVQKDAKTGRMTFSAPVGPALHDVVVDSLVVRVVLPEGAKDAQVTCDLPHQLERDTQITYLDVMGRPVVVLRLSNIVQDMALEPVQVSYTYSSMGLLQKPLLLVAALGAIFAVAMAAGRGSLASLASSPSLQSLVAKPHAS